MVQRGNRASLELKSLAIAFGRNLDGNYASQSRVDGPVDGSHSAGADLGFDLIRTELSARGNRGPRGIGQEAGGGRVENLATGFYFEHALHAGADIGIGTLQQSGPLVGRNPFRGVV